MIENAIIVHGKPTRERYENSNEDKPHVANWLPWLGKELMSRGVEVATPAMSEPYYPVYEDWKALFEEHITGPNTALIGHSAGAEFLLRWLSEDDSRTAKKLIAVAPYKDYDLKYGEFSQYQLDTEIVKRVGEFTIFSSTDDDQPIQRRVDELFVHVKDARLREFEGYGHFRIGHNMTTREFPELLEEVIQ